MKTPKHLFSWVAAAIVTLGLAGYFGWHLFGAEDRLVFTPGAMTNGHYQIELACDACHTPFQGVKQDACVGCHGARLAASNDAHPKSKFDDPRNADRLEILDARWCVTCHMEHRPQQTQAMGVTMPQDYCFHCHQETVKERPSHNNLAFDSCASAGCHNYHDNTALYEDFLVKHAHEPANLARTLAPERKLATWMQASFKPALTREQHDAPASIVLEDGKLLSDWASTAHAKAGVNCTDCHQPNDSDGLRAEWTDRPDQASCAQCHEPEVNGLLDSRHGMRLKQNLPPMTPGMARQPMKVDAHDVELGCTTCHGAHAFDTRHAAREACVGCHDDEHTRAFEDSPHARMALPGNAGVTCATCHLPRELHKENGVTGMRVQHNQNWNLRPNEKMVKGVCMNCHGLEFSLDALADPALIANNFRGQPARHIEGVEWAAKRVNQTSRGGKP